MIINKEPAVGILVCHTGFYESRLQYSKKDPFLSQIWKRVPPLFDTRQSNKNLDNCPD